MSILTKTESIVVKIDEFLNTPIGGDLSILSDYGRRLLQSVKSSYAISSENREFQSVLEQRIVRLQDRINDIEKKRSMLASPVYLPSLRDKLLSDAKAWLNQYSTTTLSTEEKLSKTRRYLEELKQITKKYPTREESSIIAKLTTLYNRFRAIQPPIFAAPGAPTKLEDIFFAESPAVVKAREFYERMKDVALEGEAPLTRAVNEAKAQIEKLRTAFSSLSLDERRRLENSFTGMMRIIGKLATKWKNQIALIKSDEGKNRSWKWLTDKREYEQDKYLTRKKESLEKGAKEKLVLESLDRFNDYIKKMLSVSSAFRAKIAKEKIPEAIPIGRISELVIKAEQFVSSLEGTLAGNELAEAKTKLNMLKQEQVILRNLYNMQMGAKGAESDIADKSSEGLRYFRDNLHPVVKELLTTQELSNLEREASTTVAGAKKTIKEAVYMAARKNPVKVREILKV